MRVITGVSMAVAAFLACNALTGVDDLSAVDCTGDCDASAPERSVTGDPDGNVIDPLDANDMLDAKPGTDSQPPADAGKDAAKRPTFCTGISLYLPLDNTLNAKSGQPADAPPAVAFVAGKFGQAADLTAPGGIGVYYTASYMGVNHYSLVAGSVAMWVKPTFTPPVSPVQPAVFFKPRTVRGAAVPNAGPVLGFETLLGLTVDAPDGGLTSVGYPQVPLSNWVAGGWNHLVGTWSSSNPTLQVSLNGGAPVGTNNLWVPNESPPNFLRIGSEASAPRSLFDEVVVWTRVLANPEMAALAASTVSVGDACGL